MIQKIRTWTLPIAMLLGACFYTFFSKLSFLLPYMIFSMLLITYCKTSLKEIVFTGYHFWLLLIQIAGAVLVYRLVNPYNPLLAEGLLICVITPTAAAAAAVVGMLGGNVGSLISFSILSNLSLALVGPFIFSHTGIQGDLPFLPAFFAIGMKIAPLLAFPFFLALFMRYATPGLHRFLVSRQYLSFYLWAFSLTILFGKTMAYIVEQDNYKNEFLLAGLSMGVCFLQFATGKWIGGKYGNRIAGGQALGQKNTVLAIWLAQLYLLPLVSVAPAAYVLWQNIINSWQLWRKERIRC